MSSSSSPSPGKIDPVEVDANHYQVEFENEKVRVLRVHYGPREKSPLHHHPASIAVLLKKCDFRFYNQTGGKQEIMGLPGQVLIFEEPYDHAPENRSSEAFECIMVEIKS